MTEERRLIKVGLMFRASESDDGWHWYCARCLSSGVIEDEKLVHHEAMTQHKICRPPR